MYLAGLMMFSVERLTKIIWEKISKALLVLSIITKVLIQCQKILHPTLSTKELTMGLMTTEPHKTTTSKAKVKSSWPATSSLLHI